MLAAAGSKASTAALVVAAAGADGETCGADRVRAERAERAERADGGAEADILRAERVRAIASSPLCFFLSMSLRSSNIHSGKCWPKTENETPSKGAMTSPETRSMHSKRVCRKENHNFNHTL